MKGEDRPAEQENERWEMKGVAWRVLFYVLGAYAFLNVVGLLGAHAQE